MQFHTAKTSRTSTTSNKATASGRTNNNNRSNCNNSSSRKLIRNTQAFSYSNNRNSQNDFDSIERIVTLQEQQAAQVRHREIKEVALRGRNIQQQMSFDDQEETAQQFREHSRLGARVGLQQRHADGDIGTESTEENTFDIDYLNDNVIIDVDGHEGGQSKGLQRFKQLDELSDKDEAALKGLDPEEQACTQYVHHQEHDTSKHRTMAATNNLVAAQQQQQQPIRYFNNGIEVDMDGNPLMADTSTMSSKLQLVPHQQSSDMKTMATAKDKEKEKKGTSKKRAEKKKKRVPKTVLQDHDTNASKDIQNKLPQNNAQLKLKITGPNQGYERKEEKSTEKETSPNNMQAKPSSTEAYTNTKKTDCDSLKLLDNNQKKDKNDIKNDVVTTVVDRGPHGDLLDQLFG